MSRTRVGIVGFGVMGARHARVFGALDSDFVVAGALDPHPSKIPSFLRHFVDLEELLEASDLVVIASPIEAHAHAAIRALDCGRHVFVEKPMAANAREAEMLVDQAAVAKRHLFVGHSERFNPVARALAVLLRGETIRSMSFRRIAAGAPRDASLRARHADALLNLAVHDIDLAAYLGRADVALSSAVERQGLAAIELVACEGWRATIETGRGDTPERTVTTETDAGTYCGDLRASTLTFTGHDPAQNKAFACATEEPLAAQAAAVATILRGETAPMAAGADGARAVNIAGLALALLEAPQTTAENL